MATITELREKLEEVLGPIIAQQGFHLLDLQWRPEQQGWILRLILDHETNPVTLSDCERISRHIAGYLDAGNLIEPSYNLEVSSPGVQRPLKRRQDYARFLGERIHLELKEPLAGSSQKVLTAWLEACEESALVVTDGPSIVGEASSRRIVAWDNIAKANLDPEIEI